ncbi:MAG: Cna B-type domain-containing protein [Atopobiaceae bacterium]|nr:Cna B-type domain-containing protein [Atopobiaceae bacterium]
MVLSEQNDWSADFSPVAASDDDEYIIRELTRDDKLVYAATDEGAPADWTGEVEYEVGPEDGKHIEYYVASYAYGQDEQGNEDSSRTIITNAVSQEFSVRKTWVLGSHTSERPAAVSAVLQRADDGDATSWTTVQTVELNEQNDWRATFKRVPSVERGEDGEVTQISYRVRELDKDGEVVCAQDDADAPKPEPADEGVEQKTYQPVAKLRVATGQDDGHDAAYFVSYEPAKDAQGNEVQNTTQITNTLGRLMRVQKTWDIDLEGKDRPSKVKVRLQRRDDSYKPESQDSQGEKWEDVQTIELSATNDWEGTFDAVPMFKQSTNTDGSPEEYTYRVRELDKDDKVVYNKGDKDDFGFIETLKGKVTDWDALWQVDWTTDAWKKYITDKKTAPQTPVAIFKVEGSKPHETKYLVSYTTEDNTTKITNTAVMDVSIYKRWLMFGEAKKPESVYLMLMGRVKQTQGSSGSAAGGAAGSASGATNKVPYLPVYNALYGDVLTGSGLADIVGIKGTLNKVGVKDETINGTVKLGLALAKAKDNPDNALTAWRVRFGVRKYDAITKMEMEYLGAELVTGLIKIGTDTITGFSWPAMLQPISPRYLSVFGKAFNIFRDYELTSNVINTWLSLDGDIVDGVGGTKYWKDNDNADGKRPSEVKLHLYYQDDKDNKVEVTGSPVTVKASDNWAWSLGFKKGDPAVGKNLTIEEEVPEGYTCKVDGYDVTNTRDANAPQTVTVEGKKTWDDGNDADGKRPGSIVVRLMANGKEKDRQTVTAANGWKWTFANQPKLDENGNQISYAIEEEPVSGYRTSVLGYNITNTHEYATVGVRVSKLWDDANDADGKRPSSVTVHLTGAGEEKTLTLDEASGWSGTFSNLPKLDGSGNQIEYVVDEDAVEGYQKSVEGNATSGYTITNRHEPQKTEVKVTKVWNDANDQDGMRPEALEVYLQANGSDAGKSVTLDEASGWSGTFSDLPKYAGGEEVAYTIREEVVAGYESKTEGTASEGFTITNTHEPRKVDVRVTKHWVDAENQAGKRPASVTVHLKANGEDMGAKTLSSDSGWSAAWEGKDRFKDGEEVSFEVTEDAVEGYQAEVSGDADQGFVVTNTLDPGTTTVEGRKTWDDAHNKDGLRPASITVRLWANGREIKTKTVSGDATSNDGWTWKWEDLPKYENGEEIAYVVTEDAVPSYTTSVSGYDVTNTHAPNKTSVSVTKRWDDDGNRDGMRPASVRVQLYANGAASGEPVTLSLSTAWTHTFSDLDQNDASGKRIAYTVREVGTVEGYQATVEGNAMQGFVITNKHEPQKTTVKARKVWDDDHNRDGKRPEYITVRLMDGSREAARQTLSVGEANEQTFEFADVLANQDGKPISYTLAEEPVADYVTTYGSDDDGTLVVTNTHEPQTIPFKGTKLWEDDENRDGIRPDSITVHVRREGSQTDVLAKTIRASEQGEWSWEFDGLYRYQNGEEVSYVLTEDPIEGYQTSISGTAEQGYTITNRHKPTTREISVAKMWDDNNDQDGLRPQTVLVWLLANGKRTGAKLSLSQGDNWRGRFANLPVNEGGQPITYTVEEDVPSGYEATVTGDAAAGFSVTNRHEPQTVSVEGRKTWVDSNDYAGMRPNKITVRLRANGEVVGSKTVSAADDWSWKWENLAKYSDGKQIAYTVTEDAVAHYVVAYDGTNVQNTYARDKVSVDVTRVWKDADDQDGIRPAFVKLVLKANGEPVATSKGFVVISSYDSGTYTFTGLPKQDKDGKDIAYTVEEELTDVLTGTDGPGTYAVAVTGDATSGFVVTNTHTPQTVTVAGAKTWKDDGNAANLRPGRITIRLRANGVVCGIKNVWGTQTTDEGWSWRFEDLPMYENGKRIAYTVTEDAVEYYEQSYDGYNVTNTLNADDRRGRVSVELNRVWDDFNNADLLRPKYVMVRLLANGEPIAGEKYFMVLSDYDNGSYRFTGLPKTDEYGDEIVYTVEEVRTDVLGDEDTPSSYAVHILGDAEQGFTIVNVHTPELVSVKGQKVWDDEGYQEERPDSIVVRLLANGEEFESSDVAAAADGTWRWEFDDLPKYLAGKAVTYEMEEEAVRGYEATVEGDMASGFTVTNKYRPDDPHPDDSTQASYAVHVYYEHDGAYANKPDDVWVRTAATGAEVSVTDEDTTPTRDRYDLDDRYANARTGIVAADGSLVLKVYFRQVFLITYDPNGGVLDGDTSNVVERHYYGDEITIRKAPTLTGSTFTYWKGSAYHPGDAYTVTADHTFVAQWKKTTKPGDNTPDKTTPPHTPGSTTTVKIPRTGDSTVAASWLLAPAAAVLAIALRRRRA